MRRAALAVLLSLAALPSAAGWIELKQDEGVTVSIERGGPTELAPGVRQVWLLEDNLPSNSAGAPKSRKTLWRMECERQRMGIKAFVSYLLPSGMGGPSLYRFHDEAAVKFDDVVPGTFGEIVFKLTCGATTTKPPAARATPL